MPLYTPRQDRIVLTAPELSALDDMLKASDRAGFYMTYYAMTDSNEALLQAKVATFSGLTGGAAFAANRFLQDQYGQTGTVSPGQYPGIYFLSQAVAREAYNTINVDGTVSSTLVSFAYQADKKTVIYMWFSGEWIARLALLSKNQNISVVGQLKNVTNYNSTVELENCELVDAPAQTPNAATRPRRRRSARSWLSRRPSGGDIRH